MEKKSVKKQLLYFIFFIKIYFHLIRTRGNMLERNPLSDTSICFYIKKKNLKDQSITKKYN